MSTRSARSNSNTADGSGSSRFRHRKISIKQRLRIYKPSDLKNLDKQELQQRDVVEIETGVEKHEEKEVHLHRILLKNNAGIINSQKKEYIPTPDASHKWDEFNKFYTGKFNYPKSYIQFSATVEDCCSNSYLMDEIDDAFLNDSINKNISDSSSDKKSKLTEDEFEILCTSFELAIHERQPFLSVDPENILSFEELKPTLMKTDIGDINIKNGLSKEINLNKNEKFVTEFDIHYENEPRPIENLLDLYGEQVYNHWKSRKITSEGAEIFPQLKFERRGEKDDSNPYVCFRRRDVRLPRKTRRVDIVNTQKLRLLLQALRNTKELASLVAKREHTLLNLFDKETKVFEDRCNIKKLKRKFNIVGDEEDLINHKRKRVNISKKLKKDSPSSDASTKKTNKSRLTKEELEEMFKSGQKLTKSQLYQLQQFQNPKDANATIGPLSSKLPKQQITQQQLQQQQKQLLQQQLLQQQQEQVSNVYVKLPTSKVPDIVLEDVEDLLSNKERNARKFVLDRMEKRNMDDKNLFFNLTDDPYNPVFDVTLPKGVDLDTAPFASIALSKFQIDRAYYVPHMEEYFKGTSKHVTAFNKNGEIIQNANPKYKQLEIYNSFKSKNEILSKEHPVKFRRRIGRNGVMYIDCKPNVSVVANDNKLSEFFDFDKLEEENNSREPIDIYDSQMDAATRLYGKWKYDSPRHEYGLNFYEEPPRLNQISNDTQTIRFGTMLGSKAYDQLRDITSKYRKEYFTRISQQRLNAQNHIQTQQQTPNGNGDHNSDSKILNSQMETKTKIGNTTSQLLNKSNDSQLSKSQPNIVPVAQQKSS
ncbi:hypothetical protein TPHA_0D00480 [Tetrapisispora phaffii CBS 4417]|uniref:Enhancer of polycomb-like protein n=1 Tax=Tetrapisispora phaffii (strain ATCC 24235 / CBS 4417 / NBRC 1672 / NRRL Y-8282 / UCD 70-5) TaxID=1071381 RepID=G8BS71_TETPH|nr:hypothetical protein TPHA_0D00480 [Tetrapisispora phaffii CBS 4417]CCE62692.1 hypothetical protein TPHA_0D00480 [Tetrapisispora phaffii CBS 4417]